MFPSWRLGRRTIGSSPSAAYTQQKPCVLGLETGPVLPREKEVNSETLLFQCSGTGYLSTPRRDDFEVL